MNPVMKELHLRPSCVNRIPNLSLPPAINAPVARTAISEMRGSASISRKFALRPTLILPPEKQQARPRRIDGDVLGSMSGRHLWLVLRSEQHRRGAFWETAGFLAIWFSGIIGVAICFL
jgi:hypothetical protein